MPFQIIQNDITKVSADAIVNTANPQPVIGGGTDSAIYHAAGEAQLLEERRKIGSIQPGNAVSTPAFSLKARYIIHTVGPVWIDGNHSEREILHSCYANSLKLAAELSCKSIAFPLIATGVYEFPKDEALDIALKEIGKFLLTHEMNITLVVFDKKAMELSEKLVGEIDKYIDDHAIETLREKEYGCFFGSLFQRRRIQKELEQIEDYSQAEWDEELTECKNESMPKMAPYKAVSERTESSPLDEVLKKKEDTFQQRLFKLIDERGLDDVTVYKRANVDRKLFSKIRSRADYHPKKKTAVAFAIALKLDMPTMQDLLSRAEFALSPGNKFDLIISYFVNSGNYDIYEINSALFKYGQPILGE
ncbi:MAG: macro domain-containing protein [Anaerolineaceae bacterium]|nr:macro domain-containing protein [Anaerolineaceae bacterium]